MNTSEQQYLYERVLACRRKRGIEAHSFENLKPVIIALLNNKSFSELAKETNMHTQTLHNRKIAALEYLDPNNTKRVMSAEDLDWLKNQVALAEQSKRL